MQRRKQVLFGRIVERPQPIAQSLGEGRSYALVLQAVDNIRHEESELVAAVISDSGKLQAIEGLLAKELNHGIGQLNFASGAALLALDLRKDLGLQNIPPGDDQIGGSGLGLRLLDHGGDLEGVAARLADADGAIAMNLVDRNLLNRDDVAAGFLVDVHHLLEAAGLAVNQHVGEQQSERLI